MEKTILTMKEYNRLLAPYHKASWKMAVRQMLDTVLPVLALIFLMLYSTHVSLWLTLLLLLPTSGFLIRTFILFHDCGHNSFTPSVRANKIIGFFLGVLTLTPGEQWWKSHAIHHATSGNIDRRGVGDVETWTVAEYQSRPWIERIGYNLFRFPLIMFGLGPLWMFLIQHRFALPRFDRRATLSVVWNNLALLVWLGGLSLIFGPLAVLGVMLPIFWIAGMTGIWLFYVQHQFEGVYWAHESDWSYVLSAVKGASYYQLPKILQWFSGNIGFHHIHHLSPRIPNYRLEEAYNDLPILRAEVKTIKFLEAIPTIRLRLIDEAHNNRLVTFQDILG